MEGPQCRIFAIFLLATSGVTTICRGWTKSRGPRGQRGPEGLSETNFIPYICNLFITTNNVLNNIVNAHMYS